MLFPSPRAPPPPHTLVHAEYARRVKEHVPLLPWVSKLPAGGSPYAGLWGDYGSREAVNKRLFSGRGRETGTWT